MKKEEQKLWEKDGLQEDLVENFIITNDIDEDNDNTEVTEVTEVDGDVPQEDDEEEADQPSPDEDDQRLLKADQLAV